MLHQTKKNIRAEIFHKRKALSSGEVFERTSRILNNFLSLKIPPQIENIAIYYPIQGEVETRSFFKHFQKLKKNILFPKVEGELLNFYPVKDFIQLQLGAFGIAEPVPKTGEKPVSPDLIILPALAYSPDGHRLGYGKGFYDRTLSKIQKKPLLVGVAYDFQIRSDLLPDSHDVPADVVVSEFQTIVLNDIFK